MNRPDAAFSGRVLVTGARGFIGRRLMARGAALGLNFFAFPGRLTDLAVLPIETQAVVHLAAVARPPVDVGGRLILYDTNVAGTQAVLDACAAAGAGVVFASTSGVYARRDETAPLTEDAPLEPASDYALSKYLAEKLIRHFCRRTGLPGTVLRLFNVYGPEQPENFLVPEVVDRLLTGEPLVLRSPEVVRDFVAVDDVVEAILTALARPPSDQFAVYNIGGGQGTRVRDLVVAVERVYGGRAQLDLSLASSDQDRVVADVLRAASELSWRPKLSLEQGLEAIRQHQMFKTS